MVFIDKNSSFSNIFSEPKRRLIHEAQSKNIVNFDSIASKPIDSIEQSIFDIILKYCDGSTTPYVAGGWVRDKILGRNSKDIDIAVYSSNDTLNAGIRLAQMINVHENNDNKDIVIVNDKGTSQVKINGIQVEFCPFRAEEYTSSSSKPIVKPGNLETEVLRRDFTINSLLYNIKTGEIIDYTGKGISDLKNGIIRTTNDPNITFTEDPNRIMRAFRFMATLGFNLDDQTKQYIGKFSNTLNPSGRTKELKKNTSGEENFSQLYKMFAVDKSENIVNALYTMAETGALYSMLGLDEDRYYPYNEKQMNRHHFNDSIFDHIMKVFKNVDQTLPESKEDRFVLRMSALLHDFGKFSKKIRTQVKPDYLERLKSRNPNEESLGWHQYNYINHGVHSTDIANKSLHNNIRVPSDLKNRIVKLIKFHDVLMLNESGSNYSDKIKNNTFSNYDAYKIANSITSNGRNPEDLNLFITLIKSDRAGHLDNRNSDIQIFENTINNIKDKLWSKPSDIIDGDYIVSILDSKVDKSNITVVLNKIMEEYLNGQLKINPEERALQIAIEMKIAKQELMPKIVKNTITGQWIKEKVNPPKDKFRFFKEMIEFGNELFEKGLNEQQIVNAIKGKFQVI